MSSRQPEFTDEEMAAIEAEMEKVKVDDVLLQTIVSLLNLGGRKAGLGGPPRGEAGGEPTSAPEPDLEQVRQAVEGARALLPLVEPRHGKQLGPVRDALSRLQLFYAQRSGAQGAPTGEAAPPQTESGPGKAQSSGRLWVPGQ